MGRTVPAVERAIRILELFLDEPAPLSIPQMTGQLGIHRSSVHELVRTLVKHGLLAEDDGQPHRYVLGSRVFEIGNAYAARVDLIAEAQRVTRKVAAACNESVALAILEGVEAVYVVKADGTQVIRAVTYPGSRVKAHCTGAGKMLLASLSDDELEARLGTAELTSMTPNTITSFERLRRELAEIRARQFSFDDGEAHIGVRCLAAPVYDHLGTMVAAMSVSGPDSRMGDERRTDLEQHLCAGVLDLSHRLGYARGRGRSPSLDRSEPPA